MTTDEHTNSHRYGIKKIMIYLFELGRQPEISTAEIQAVFERLEIPIKTFKNKHKYITIETNDEIDVLKLINILGGTIKIGRQIKNVSDPVKSISHFLHENTSGKIHFSVNGTKAKQTGLSIKKMLKTQGHSVRYIEAKNTATILHNNLVEKQGDFTLVDNDIFVTTALQDIEGFATRDYDRPGSDNKSGMLPPKLARIMVNLTGADPKKDTLLDPFCGSGTVLTEALSLGFQHIIGSDNSEKAISDSKTNIEWLNKTYNLKPKTYDLLEADATILADEIEHESIDAIASEPYMGRPLYGNESKEGLEQQAVELGDLFVDSFKNFHTILKKDGIAIFIIPKFKIGEYWITIDILHNIKKIGFEIVPFDQDHWSLLYHRENQHVGREIWKFRKI